jgi:signal transduction histidine kinase
VLGALMVIAGKQGRLFNQVDVEQLERLGAQAAVAIAHSRLFGEVEGARSQLETLLISTENPVVAVSRHFRLLFVNPAAKRVFHIDEQHLDDRIDAILPENAFPKNPLAVLHTIKHEGAFIYEISQGDKVYMCHLAATGHHEIEGWVAVMNDITQLKELDRLKSEMIRMVSHDLKNPLMGAMLYLDLARDAANPATMEPLGVIERQLERMNRIIRGVLDLEQIRSGLKNHETCNAAQIVTVAVNELKRAAADKKITLQVEIEQNNLEFDGDSEQMERALINLIENAIKFTPEDGQITVNLRKDHHQALIKVRDTGIGIPKEMFQQVFERFFRGRQKGVEHVSGSGLGLSIVKTIVENHQGKIWLESEEGKGTTFFITLPLLETPSKVKL